MKIIKLNKEIKIKIFVVGALVFSFIIGLCLWVFYSPIVMWSMIFWIGLVTMGIPIYIALESFGELGLSRQFVKRLPRSIRIIYGVIWVLIGMVIFLLIVAILSELIILPT